MNLIKRRVSLVPREDNMISDMFASMEKHMLSVFDSGLLVPAPTSSFGYNVKNTEKSSIVDIALPGTEKDKIHLNTREDGDGDHTIEIWVGDEKDSKKKGNEISFALSENHDHENVEAEYNNGLLTITVPRVVRVNPKVGKIDEIKIN